MSRDLNSDERAALEILVDHCSLTAVLEALSGICGEKADHIYSSYGQGDATARRWAEAEGVIGCAAADISKRGV